MHNKKAYYKDRVLTYDYDKSQGMIVPIYTDPLMNGSIIVKYQRR